MRSSLDELSTRGNCSGKATRRLSHLTRTPSCRQSEEEWCWAESARGKPRPRPGAGSPACSNSCSPAPTQATGKSGLLLLLWKHVCCHRCKSTALDSGGLCKVVCLFGQRRAKLDGHWQFFFADICKHCNPTTTSSYLSLQTGSDLSNTALHQIEFIKNFSPGNDLKDWGQFCCHFQSSHCNLSKYLDGAFFQKNSWSCFRWTCNPSKRKFTNQETAWDRITLSLFLWHQLSSQ